MAKVEEEKLDLTRLPTKYRRYIEKLESTVRELTTAKAKTVRTRIAVGRLIEEPMYLDDRSTVTFILSEATAKEGRVWGVDRLDMRIETLHDGSLAVKVMGEHAVAVYPEVSNVVMIQSRRTR